MATEVLRPHDVLGNRFPAFHGRKAGLYNNHYRSQPPRQIRNKTSPVRSEQKRKQPATISRKSSSDDLKSSRQHHQHHHNKQPVVTGQVTILRRGEPLDLKPKVENIGPEPSRVETTQIRNIKDQSPNSRMAQSPVPAAMYAGSAFAVSPAPESLPLPSFSKKKQISAVDTSATRDLRRLLRLEC